MRSVLADSSSKQLSKTPRLSPPAEICFEIVSCRKRPPLCTALHLQNGPRTTAQSHLHMPTFSNGSWQRRTSSICPSPVYSPRDHSTPLPALAHSFWGMQMSERLLTRTLVLIQHQFFMSDSQLTHSLLLGFALWNHIVREKTVEILPSGKTQRAVKLSRSAPLRGRIRVFHLVLLFPLQGFDCRSGLPLQKVKGGMFAPWQNRSLTLLRASASLKRSRVHCFQSMWWRSWV